MPPRWRAERGCRADVIETGDEPRKRGRLASREIDPFARIESLIQEAITVDVRVIAATHRNLEQRVASKTQSLAERNNELSALYAIGAFLSEPRPLDAMCQGFMERVAKATALPPKPPEKKSEFE